jgi:UDP:flavonoid glycosyltransferase YjiC (YdhE family)
MKYLFCTHANPGTLGPSVALAKELRARGHEVAFVSAPAAASWLDREGFPYLAEVPNRPSGFEHRLWYDSAGIILQCASVIDAVRMFAPDVLVGQQLTIAPYVVHDILDVPLAVIGMAAWMYPTKSGSGLWLLRNESHWRHEQFLARVNTARASFDLPPLDSPSGEPLAQADLFLLRSVPGLEHSVEDLPSRVHCIGALVEPLAAGEANARYPLSGPCIYVQQGKIFNGPGFLDTVIAGLAGTPYTVIVDSSELDGPLPDPLPPNVWAVSDICVRAALKGVSTVVTTGHSTAVLSALLQGVPLLLFPNGSGTTDIAARCLAAGVAIVADPGSITPSQLREYVETLSSDRRYRSAARGIAGEFASHEAPRIAAELLEKLGSTRQPVLRDSARVLFQAHS